MPPTPNQEDEMGLDEDDIPTQPRHPKPVTPEAALIAVPSEPPGIFTDDEERDLNDLLQTTRPTVPYDPDTGIRSKRKTLVPLDGAVPPPSVRSGQTPLGMRAAVVMPGPASSDDDL